MMLEGCFVCSIERLTGVHRDTILVPYVYGWRKGGNRV